MATYLKYDRFTTENDIQFSSEERIDALVKDALSTIKEFLSLSKKNVIAFSGGKDSIVLTHLCSTFGIRDAITETAFMFPKSLMETKATAEFFGLNVIYNEGLTWDWLKKHPEFCAPVMKLQPKLYSIRQQKTVKTLSRKNKYTGVLYGRRLQENTVKAKIYTLANGQYQCHPLRDWKTNDIWTYIYRNALPFPSLYKHEIGRKDGFTSFLLPPEHYDNVWKVIYSYDPNVVHKFAEFHEPASNFLKSRPSLP